MAARSPYPTVADASPRTVAAVDLGSNSFHLIVARTLDGDLQVIDRIKEMVRLGEGLTADKMVRPEVAERALACLDRFGQRLRGMPPGDVRAVGTNTLRQIRPESGFLERTERALGHPIDVIAGREEARLIYLGVAHGLAAGDELRLVVDIGGGSTELIVGQCFTPRLRESLHMGCVSLSQRYFADGRITAKSMERAELAGALEVRPIRELFRRTGWDKAVGSSGTIKAIAAVMAAEGWCNDGISAEALERLRNALVEQGSVEALAFKGLSDRRRPVFAGGVAALRAVFLNLGVHHMQVSDEALREGLIYEMVGRDQHEDVRERTVRSLAQRFGVDKDHAERVEQTAAALFEQAAGPWQLVHPNDPVALGFAARLHEIGLIISHSSYQKHGAYLLSNADLSGFTRQAQQVLATLVLGHRRKFPSAEFNALPKDRQVAVRRLCVLLRLAVLMHRGRSETAMPCPRLRVEDETVELTFPDRWLADHALTRLELEEEAARFTTAGFALDFG
ncbi:exopolyphosphatase [Thioflavicoccus mobilis 8321]|uniref:Exopolyphosphatase n=1 Tax=Thioflavicoccus mobilis 8321 TaxID=765912 RepID=L0GW54_9GAMM|nr:Ppx/GppA phosphatase family protein [Thioflavicoccus mobilis]AGA89524.1 exopolyphosphatase [Thioflavicoccus mobilis 8321]